MNEPSIELNNGHENNPKASLQSFLDNNYELIRRMRARIQHQEAGGNNDSVQMMQLTEFIKNTTRQQQVFIEDYRLCTISDNGQQFSHGGKQKFEPNLDLTKSIRGFYFGITFKGQSFECVVLDQDNTMPYFYSKTLEDRERFVQRFADRKTDARFVNSKVVAFIAELPNDNKFEIETIVVSSKR